MCAALPHEFAEASGPFVAVHASHLEYEPAVIERRLLSLRDGRADVFFGRRFTDREKHRVLFY